MTWHPICPYRFKFIKFLGNFFIIKFGDFQFYHTIGLFDLA